MSAIKYTINNRTVIAEFQNYDVYGKDLFSEQLCSIYEKEMKHAFQDIDFIADAPVISLDFNKIEAFIKHNGYPKGIAKCSPEDKFNENKGKLLAKERLIFSEYKILNKFYNFIEGELFKLMHHINLKIRNRCIKARKVALKNVNAKDNKNLLAAFEDLDIIHDVPCRAKLDIKVRDFSSIPSFLIPRVKTNDFKAYDNRNMLPKLKKLAESLCDPQNSKIDDYRGIIHMPASDISKDNKKAKYKWEESKRLNNDKLLDHIINTAIDIESKFTPREFLT